MGRRAVVGHLDFSEEREGLIFQGFGSHLKVERGVTCNLDDGRAKLVDGVSLESSCRVEIFSLRRYVLLGVSGAVDSRAYLLGAANRFTR